MAGRLNQDFLEIDFLVVSDIDINQNLTDKKYCSQLEIPLVKGQLCCVIALYARFSIARPEKRTSNAISYSFRAITLKLSGYFLETNTKIFSTRILI